MVSWKASYAGKNLQDNQSIQKAAIRYYSLLNGKNEEEKETEKLLICPHKKVKVYKLTWYKIAVAKLHISKI
jgi:hypothetical protein